MKQTKQTQDFNSFLKMYVQEQKPEILNIIEIAFRTGWNFGFYRAKQIIFDNLFRDD